MHTNAHILTALVVFAGVSTAAAPNEGWVSVKGGALRPDNAAVRVDDFEMCDHPVTNAEYKLFVDATKHTAPVHWEKGAVPAGMAHWPVIFVNRNDAAAYAAWLTKKEKRIHRLPTSPEFEYAARAGQAKAEYPWGNEPPEGKANYDPAGQRNLGQWRKFLKQVKSYAPNPWGLYDMAGNVFQMTDRYGDTTVQGGYTFRVLAPGDREASFAGGSWARSARLLRCGASSGSSSGLRTPELGFRMVREPAGSTHFQRQPRRMLAAGAAGGGVFVSWQLLPGDAPDVGFHVYRAPRRDSAGVRITKEPVRASTNFTDRGGERAGSWYRVRPVLAGGLEGVPSDWATARWKDEGVGVIAKFQPTVKQGGFVPVFGDLDGDGALDALMRLDNGMRENQPDPGLPVELEAFLSGGRFLWRRALVRWDHSYGNANNVPVMIYDVDGDGKGEVICRLQEGDAVYLAVLNGMTGETLRKTPWPKMLTDNSRTSSRVHMAIAYLDGKTPSIITQTGLYENEVIDAWDAKLRKVWEYRSVAETSGGGSHHIEVADIDGDGKDEIFIGTTVLGPDGKLRWSLYRQHPDIVAVKRILPGSKGRQVFYTMERDLDAGAYLVDANDGKILWKVNRDDDPRWMHAHIGWAADIWEGSPGLELLTNRDGHEAQDQVLFAADGKILMNPFPPGWRPAGWTGGAVRELMTMDGAKLGRFTGKGIDTLPIPGPNPKGKATCSMAADLAGDYREEVVCTVTAAQGAPAVYIFTNTEPLEKRALARTASREYSLWLARNLGAGYSSYFEWEP